VVVEVGFALRLWLAWSWILLLAEMEGLVRKEGKKKGRGGFFLLFVFLFFGLGLSWFTFLWW
jgi:hypothetical protein